MGERFRPIFAYFFPVEFSNTKLRQYKVQSKNAVERYLKRKLSQLRYERRKQFGQDFPFSITIEDLMRLWDLQEGCCALTGLSMTYHRDGEAGKALNVSIDRKDPTGPYAIENVQLTCFRINSMKSNTKEQEFFWWIRTAVLHSCS